MEGIVLFLKRSVLRALKGIIARSCILQHGWGEGHQGEVVCGVEGVLKSLS